MDVVYARCAGLDVHKATVVACVRSPGLRAETRHAETQTFATTLRGLAALAAWLTAHAVTHVAMESTGVYWRPVFAVLEGTVQVQLVNARSVDNYGRGDNRSLSPDLAWPAITVGVKSPMANRQSLLPCAL